jgi:predicted transcriptional regulator
MPRRKKGEKVMTSLYLDKDLKDQLDEIAEKEDRSLAWLINNLIREGLKGRKNE